MEFILVTRKSALALWQANYVKSALEQKHPDLNISILGISTAGDKILDTPLNKIGGKGLFVKELEDHLLKKQAHFAVHSMKDVPANLPEGLELAAILERADARDAFVSEKYASLLQLPHGAKVGTSSLRRQAQLAAIRPDLVLEPLRGNVDTRILKLKRGEYDAEVLAVAGLERLGLQNFIKEFFSYDVMLPAVGQGALGIECRSDDTEAKKIVASLNHDITNHCVLAERSMNALLGGSCQLPVAGYAKFITESADDEVNTHEKAQIPKVLHLRGMVAEPDGSKILRADAKAIIKNSDNIESLGKQVAKLLLEQGADRIIEKINSKAY